MSTRSMGLKFDRMGLVWAAAVTLSASLPTAFAADSSRSSGTSRRIEWKDAQRVERPAENRGPAERLVIPRPPAEQEAEESPAEARRANPMRPNPMRRQAAPARETAARPTADARGKTMIAQAAYGEIVHEPIPPGLQPVAPYGHSLACDGCGDCGSCDACPTCGVEAACGVEPFYGGEVSCGIEGYACGAPGCDSCGGYAEPGCGVAPGHPARGLECIPLCLPILPIDWCRFEFFAGVQGFSGPPNFPAGLAATDRAGTGSFGFHQGLNEGRSLLPWLGIDWGAQLGARATQNNGSGAAFTADERHQVFVTGGFFRRVDYGLQMGLVVDYLNDDWYYHTDLTQLRGELSWKFAKCHELGYRFMAGNGDSESVTTLIDSNGGEVNGTVLLQPTDQHRFFYRRDLGGEGLVDVFLGTTDEEDTLYGVSVDTPLRGRLGLKTGFAYLDPSEADGPLGNRNESWNVSLSLVWRPCGKTGKCDGYYKPLFDVADNGTFMVDR